MAKNVKFNKGLVKHGSENIANLQEALAADKCGCFYVDCCPCPHFKLEAIDGSGNDYIYNDGTALVVTDKETFEAACTATKSA